MQTNSDQQSKEFFPIVGIGASAGGLEALQALFEAMPDKLGISFVVVVHLSPEHPSELASILARCTKIPVYPVSNTMELKPDIVYVIPPDRRLEITDSHISALPFEKPRGQRAPIDIFFRSLVKWHGDSYAVILSGGGSDGSIGIKSIKEQGGLVLVQDPDEASFDAMPRSSIATGKVDFVLPVRELAAKLGELTHSKERLQTFLNPSQDLNLDKINTNALEDILLHLKAQTGHDFSNYKRSTILRRIARRLQVCHRETFPEYLSFLQQNTEEGQALFEDLLISVTSFFRDPAAWKALQQYVIVPLLDNLPKNEPFRAWVPGCATGEEAYSLAMLLLETAKHREHFPDVQIFASDLDKNALAIARAGLYPTTIVADISTARLQKFFYRKDNHYQVKKELRECVIFAHHNMLKDPPFSQLSLISCRNLLIYLNRKLQEQLFGLFHYALKRECYLFLGISEDAEGNYFEVLDKSNHLFQAKTTTPEPKPFLPNLLLSMQPTMPHINGNAHPGPDLTSLADKHRQLLEDMGPPSLLINKHRQIIHLSETAGRYLHQPGGLPTQEIDMLIRSELQSELRAMLHRLFDTGQSCMSSFIPVKIDSETARLVAIWACLKERANHKNEDTLALIVFIESSETAKTVTAEKILNDRPLQTELEQTRQWLRAVTEEHETANEELRVANEELQSINEEYRSTAEELETSKEELQSINEELQTVNNELKQKLDEVSHAHNDLENLMAATEIGILFLDRHLLIKRFTPPIAALFNIKPSDRNRSISDFTHHLDYLNLENDAHRVLDDLSPIERETISANGSYFQVRLRPYRTADNYIDGVVITFVDITKRKQAENALRASEERYRLLINSAQEYAIFMIDTEGRIASWNIGAERIFGYTEDQILGQPVALLFTLADRNARIPELEMQKAIDCGSAADDRWHLRQDNSRFWANGAMERLLDTNNQLYGFVKVLRDNTERKQAEEAQRKSASILRRQTSELQRYDQQKNLFLGVLGHELRNPLAAIQNGLSVIKLHSKSISDEDETYHLIRKYLLLIDRQSQYMAQLLDDLLDITRINTGKINLKCQPVQLQKIIKEIVATHKASFDIGKVQIIEKLSSEPIYLNADPFRLKQVLNNLLRNAVKFTGPNGKITISTHSQDNKVIIKFTDTGIGISAKAQKTLFSPYRQIKNKQDGLQAEEGLGLGLALVKSLIELHHGTVEVHSDGHNKGSEFQLTLPLLASSEVKNSDLEPKLPLTSTTANRPWRILLVDDKRSIVNPLADILRAYSHHVEIAYDGKTAIQIAQKKQPEVAILDIGLPDMSGIELAQQLRQHFPSDKLTLIGLSGYDQKDQTLRDAGFDDFLLKPVNIEKIITLLNQIA